MPHLDSKPTPVLTSSEVEIRSALLGLLEILAERVTVKVMQNREDPDRHSDDQ